MTVATYVLALAVGQALGYILVRFWIWAWPSLSRLLTPAGREEYRRLRTEFPLPEGWYPRWRATLWAFEQLPDVAGSRRRAR